MFVSALPVSSTLSLTLASSPHSFLHPHWWLDKLNMTGSVLQLVNGAFLLLSFVRLSTFAFPQPLTLLSSLDSFFGARIAWGGYMTYVLWHLLDNPRMSPSLRWGFRAANIALNGAPTTPRLFEMHRLNISLSCSAQLVVVPTHDPLGPLEAEEAGRWKGRQWEGGRGKEGKGAVAR